MGCASCGAENRPGAKFCFRCGTQLAPSEVTSSEGECPSCGKPLRAGAKFCAACGATIAPVTAESAPAPELRESLSSSGALAAAAGQLPPPSVRPAEPPPGAEPKDLSTPLAPAPAAVPTPKGPAISESPSSPEALAGGAGQLPPVSPRSPDRPPEAEPPVSSSPLPPALADVPTPQGAAVSPSAPTHGMEEAPRPKATGAAVGVTDAASSGRVGRSSARLVGLAAVVVAGLALGYFGYQRLKPGSAPAQESTASTPMQSPMPGSPPAPQAPLSAQAPGADSTSLAPVAPPRETIAAVPTPNSDESRTPKPYPAGEPEAPAALAVPAPDEAMPLPRARSGRDVYAQVCRACHGTGVSGSPRLDDVDAWRERRARGRASLYASVIAGKGAMPPRAGRADLRDEEVRAAVDYMDDIIARRDRAASAPPPASPPRQAQMARPEPPPSTAGARPHVPQWLSAMRGELAACGRADFMQRLVCAERVRWKYCVDRWDQVDECAVSSR